MKILAPLNSPREIRPLLEAGADEIYCGVLAREWKDRYTNVGSINRREWSTSNLNTYQELEEVLTAAHHRGAKVYLTFNALYTTGQYELLLANLHRVQDLGVDAVIVADLGLLLTLHREGFRIPIHVSTGGTTFNHHTARFYQELGASRVVIPRHHNLDEIRRLVARIPFMETEVFIFNSGCKNIDGFCTFHHGVNEHLHKGLWKLPKALGLDYKMLKAMRRLPDSLAQSITRSAMFKSDSACFLNYKVEVDSSQSDKQKVDRARKTLESSFNLWSGLDPCGACDLIDLKEIGITSIKIVGRENPSDKKIHDVRFLRACLDYLEENPADREDYRAFAISQYRKIFGTDCRKWCYYPRVETG